MTFCLAVDLNRQLRYWTGTGRDGFITWVEALLPVSECISPKLPESSADALQGFDREGFAIGGALCFRGVRTAWERIGLGRPVRAPGDILAWICRGHRAFCTSHECAFFVSVYY